MKSTSAVWEAGSAQRRVPRMWSSLSEDLLIPEVTLPAQFHDIWHHSRAIAPDRALALAVLWQAVLDLQKYRFAKRRRQQRLYAEAYRWVESNDRMWPYSFVNLCGSLDLPAAAVREQMLGIGASASENRNGKKEVGKKEVVIEAKIGEAA